eukprot:m.71763 g.71763  ORF g.71763 m.71763 type:complete len:92 (-) comp18662_c0_seq2:60-335(-)
MREIALDDSGCTMDHHQLKGSQYFKYSLWYCWISSSNLPNSWMIRTSTPASTTTDTKVGSHVNRALQAQDLCIWALMCTVDAHYKYENVVQ